MKRCFNGNVYFFSYLIFYANVPSGFKKQQNEDSPDHIILHHTPAALLQAEKNLIHLDAGLSLLSHFLGLFVQCLGSLCTFYFIYKIVSVSILFKSMQSNIRGVNH